MGEKCHISSRNDDFMYSRSQVSKLADCTHKIENIHFLFFWVPFFWVRVQLLYKSSRSLIIHTERSFPAQPRDLGHWCVLRGRPFCVCRGKISVDCPLISPVGPCKSVLFSFVLWWPYWTKIYPPDLIMPRCFVLRLRSEARVVFYFHLGSIFDQNLDIFAFEGPMRKVLKLKHRCIWLSFLAPSRCPCIVPTRHRFILARK